MLLLALGAVGDYVARTYEETKGRPLYVVNETCNVSSPQHGLTRAVLLENPQPRKIAVIGADEAPGQSIEAETLNAFTSLRA
ncbi:MAG: hypothetical protein JF584_12305 [Acidobacteria bacterium]|nr:hypothetical protein [Acidobacteriota bacterium]